MDIGIDEIFLIFILVMSVILHEIAHGYVAYLCGDPTAAKKGRLTLNPVAHIDPFMTILLPVLLVLMGSRVIFGGAKPVPINHFLLKRWPRDFILVSIAGVAVNFAIAAALALLVHLPVLSDRTRMVLAAGAYLNIFLGVFNLVPIPPLDGSRVFRFLLPRDLREKYDRIEPVGIIVILACLFLGLLNLLVPIVLALTEWLGILKWVVAWFVR